MGMRYAESGGAYGERLCRLLRPSFLVLLVAPSVLLLVLHASPASSATFRCAAGGTQQQPVSCESLLGFPTPPNATYTFLKTLFGIKSIHRLFAANNLPPTTDPTTPIPALTVLRIPLPCTCTPSGAPSPTRPVYYKPRTDSSLDFVARSVFEGFVDARELAAANGIGDPTSKVGAGKKLRVPLPCSCGRVAEGSDVVHYAHKVAAGDTLEGVAAEFGTKVETLKAVNGIESVRADQVLDVPLRVCSSSVRTDSLDSPLIVPNNSYVVTAGNCVQCGCSASTWQLQCSVIQVQGLKTKWPVCPPATCPSANLTLGNTTSSPIAATSSSSSSSSCDATMCAYAGYTKDGILTTLTPTSVCPAGTTGGSSSPVTSGGGSASSRVVGVVEMGMGMWILLLSSTLFYFRVI